jgi:2-isopropylmalate synthase
VHRKKADAMLEDIATTIAECRKRCDDVEFIADDSSRADGAYLREVIARAIQAGATTITVCDAAGAMLPDEFAGFIRSLFADVPELSDVTLGVSCSDELYMADACAIAGIIEGVGEVKASTYPMDVVSLGRLSKILADKADACQATTTVRTTELKRAIGQVSWICESGRSPYSPFETGVREADESILLTERDSAEAVMQCVAKLGYDLSPEDQAAVYEAFQRVASKKESVGSRELDAIVASAALQVPATYKLDSYVINSGNRIKATANICILKGDETLQAVCVGDGPIDAAFLAIEEIAGQHYELDDFQVNSVTQGQEAMGETVVKLIWEGKVYSGRGISTDIIGSSIRAYVNALNKIVYEEQN